MRGQKFEAQSRGWQMFSIKVWRVNLFGFVGHRASVMASRPPDTANEYGHVSIKLFTDP